MKNRNKRGEYVGGRLCQPHADAHNLSARQFTLVPHHAEQADDEEILCDCCAMTIARRLGAV